MQEHLKMSNATPGIIYKLNGLTEAKIKIVKGR
jgi:hypothetical protein